MIIPKINFKKFRHRGDNVLNNMSRIQALCLPSFFRQMHSVKIFYLVVCISFALSLVWMQIVQRSDQSVKDNLVQEALENVGRDFRYSDVYRKASRLPGDLKYVLIWSGADYVPTFFLGKGQRAFLNNNCSEYNCYVTDDRGFFHGDLTRFDAIAFNGRVLKSDVPTQRSPHQKYIYFNMESADYYPVCSKVYDDFFNWTATYRLDSDVLFPYMQIRNNDGEVIGPGVNMEWLEDFSVPSNGFAERIANKSKAAAWFVSHCYTRSDRGTFVGRLQKALAPFGHTVDIYGYCGNLTCPRNTKSDCDVLLNRDYYFYMSLENSFAEDYVTEKLLNALQKDIVPVVYGGADYSRFLPPDSYLDARVLEVDELAQIMNNLINSPKEYLKYFSWKNHYTYNDPSSVENVCAVCKALNNEEMVRRKSVYPEFRKWWNPDYRRRC